MALHIYPNWKKALGIVSQNFIETGLSSTIPQVSQSRGTHVAKYSNHTKYKSH